MVDFSSHIGENKYLTFEEAAKLLCISKSTLYKMTSRREIPFYQPGGRTIYFLPDDLQEWFKKGRVKDKAEMVSRASEFCAKTPLGGALK